MMITCKIQGKAKGLTNRVMRKRVQPMRRLMCGIALVAVLGVTSCQAASNTSGNSCAVCFCGYEPEDATYVIGACKHKFHEDCITTWYRKGNKTCVICKAYDKGAKKLMRQEPREMTTEELENGNVSKQVRMQLRICGQPNLETTFQFWKVLTAPDLAKWCRGEFAEINKFDRINSKKMRTRFEEAAIKAASEFGSFKANQLEVRLDRSSILAFYDNDATFDLKQNAHFEQFLTENLLKKWFPLKNYMTEGMLTTLALPEYEEDSNEPLEPSAEIDSDTPVSLSRREKANARQGSIDTRTPPPPPRRTRSPPPPPRRVAPAPPARMEAKINEETVKVSFAPFKVDISSLYSDPAKREAFNSKWKNYQNLIIQRVREKCSNLRTSSDEDLLKEIKICPTNAKPQRFCPLFSGMASDYFRGDYST